MATPTLAGFALTTPALAGLALTDPTLAAFALTAPAQAGLALIDRTDPADPASPGNFLYALATATCSGCWRSA